MDKEGKVARFRNLYLKNVADAKLLSLRVIISDNQDAIGSMYLSFEEIQELPHVQGYSDEISFKLGFDG